MLSSLLWRPLPVLAWYGSMAGVMNATAKRIVLPTFPRA